MLLLITLAYVKIVKGDIIYNLREVIEMTGLSERTIRRYLRDKKLVGQKIGGTWRFSKEQLESFFDNQKVVEDLSKKGGRDLIDFMNGKYCLDFDVKSCVIVDFKVENKTKIREIKKEFLRISNGNRKKFQMKFYKENEYERLMIIGDIEYAYHVIKTIRREVNETSL